MKAIQVHAAGGPDVLQYEDVPRPTPGPNGLLVRVYAAGINPSDAYQRRGAGAKPAILGHDISGEVEVVGNNVSDVRVGDAVYALLFPQGGGYAEYAVAPAAAAAPKPRNLSHIQAAGVPLAALTAWQAFEAAHVRAGQTVLIHAAAGGVGTFAVQLAKARGARVIGTASGRNHDLVQSLGADEVIDYTQARFEDTVSNVDMVLDTIGGETQQRSWAVLRPGGALVSIKGAPDHDPTGRGIRSMSLLVEANAEQLRHITALIEAGQVRPVIETVLPLDQARQAHEQIEQQHTRGKIVLRIRDDRSAAAEHGPRA